MYDLFCYERKSFHYRDGWVASDDWDYLTTVRLTPMRTARPADDFDDGGTYVQYTRLPRLPRKERDRIIRSIEDTISGTNCRHSYDCCGCASFRATVRPINARDLLIRTTVSYNY